MPSKKNAEKKPTLDALLILIRALQKKVFDLEKKTGIRPLDAVYDPDDDGDDDSGDAQDVNDPPPPPNTGG